MLKFTRLFLGLGLFFVLALALVVGIIWQYEPDRKTYPVRGIDVSHHQGSIDWRKVAADDVAFAFIKASEGGDHRDSRFTINWLEAEAAGLKVGAYHFFTFCRPGHEQAANFMAVLGTRSSQLPAVLDLEFGGNCSATPTSSAIKTEIENFLEPVERQLGRPVVFYVTPEFLDAYQDALPPRPLWIRSIFRYPKQKNWLFWQYHHAGSVDGIEGRVDLNVSSKNSLQIIQNAVSP
jgi:lysozyme